MRLPLRSIGALALAAACAPFLTAQEIKPTREMVKVPDQTITQVEETTVTMEGAPQPVGYESDVYCSGYLSTRPQTFPARVIGAENLAEQIDFTTGDLVYVSAGHDRGFSAGNEFFLVTPENQVFHPITGQSLGTYYRYRGRAVIEVLQGRSSVVRITSSCTDVPLGTYLMPFEPIPIPLARRSPPAGMGDPPSGKALGHIVFNREGIVTLGADHTVLVNLGAAEGVEPGDFLTVFRYVQARPEGREIGAVGANWVKGKEIGLTGVEIPRTYLGEIAVLTVGDHWSVARVSESYRLIEVGDEVELK
jgi:hypothetical protein